MREPIKTLFLAQLILRDCIYTKIKQSNHIGESEGGKGIGGH